MIPEIEIINSTIKLIGTECCINIYESMKSNNPTIYGYRCKDFGQDIIDYVNSLKK